MIKTLRKTLYYRKQHKRWQNEYGPLAPRVGDEAPDFILWDVTGEQSVRLGDFRHRKPAALVFGSFT